MVLPKTFDAAEVERRTYDAWEAGGCFRAGANAKPDAEPYCIVIPPPNVTGALHMGHALNSTLQDILIRWHRMRGFDTLWQPGMDHAGIATQMVVERELANTGQPGRRELGREEFERRVWAWKEQYGSTIGEQFRRLGASCDWSRERFTMDEGLSEAVREVFVRLFKEKLIYRDKRLVNWDPHFETAISDLEVEQVETIGKLWYLRYPLADGSGTLEVATTRPETMLGDTGVAVHPDDERYAAFVGKSIRLPLVGREIPVVADRHVDPEAGSGAVKITPAHDFNDFAVGKRHDLRTISVMDGKACLVLRDNAEFLAGIEPSAELEATLALDGLDRVEARQRVVDMLEAQGALARVVEHPHTVPHGDRSQVPVEPHLTDQWFVDAAALVKPALAAVREGRTRFHPENWQNTYFRWLENIEPWCISRQLWWGHRIPVWYGPDGHTFAERSAAGAQAAAAEHYGEAVELQQDEDVLDTWFSSALWPFSTLGWPAETPEVDRYYPTAVLITAFDIIFFWVARMMMAGLHFMRDSQEQPEIPFHDVYVHAIVRDEEGRKMSKSLGNVLDPIELIDKYGADAVRFTLAAMAAKGRDIRLSEGRIQGYRNFATKLWNAARFAEFHECRRREDFQPQALQAPVNRWIVGKLLHLQSEIDAALADYRFDGAARALYATVWGVFCDWYLEFAKPLLADEGDVKAETQATVAWALDRVLVLAHPFMPFVTEELWRITGEHGAARTKPLIHADWPTRANGDATEIVPEAEIDLLVELIEGIRSVRSELGVPAGARVPLIIVPTRDDTVAQLAPHTPLLQRLARVEGITFQDQAPAAAAAVEVPGAVAHLPLQGLVDIPAEQARVEKRLGELNGEIDGLERRLGDEKFTSKAPEHVVEQTRLRRDAAREEAGRLNASLERLAAMQAEG